MSTFTYKKGYNADNMAPLRETRFDRFLPKQNLYLAAADHFSHDICNPFPDSKIAQAFRNAQTKQASFFGLVSNASNNQNLQMMNPVTLRGGSRAGATSKMECFVIIVNDFQPLTIITKRSILDVAAALDPPLTLTGRIFYISQHKKVNQIQ